MQRTEHSAEAEINSAKTNDLLISFVLLTWNSEKTILNAIDGIFGATRLHDIKNMEILIVDNGSRDATIDLLNTYQDRAQITVIRLETNRGTTYSRNLAFKAARGKYIVVMDSDVIVTAWDIPQSLSFIDRNNCLLAPQLSYPDGGLQPSIKRFPTLTVKLLKLLKIFVGVDRFSKKDFYEGLSETSPTAVDTAISAFWIFPREFFRIVGYLDENIFYSPEDVDYCVRIWKKNRPIYYFPAIQAIHYTQQISHRKPFSLVSLSHFRDLMYYFVKHRYLFTAKHIRQAI